MGGDKIMPSVGVIIFIVVFVAFTMCMMKAASNGDDRNDHSKKDDEK